MNFHSLVATNLPRNSRPTRMDADAEERYYRRYETSRRLWLGPAAAFVAAAAGLILLVSVAQI
jgi:hypothetical protein